MSSIEVEEGFPTIFRAEPYFADRLTENQFATILNLVFAGDKSLNMTLVNGMNKMLADTNIGVQILEDDPGKYKAVAI